MLVRSLLAVREHKAATPGVLWSPNPGPQTEALHTTADITFYGGAAGGGKTDLLVGLAITQHSRSIIFRREFPQLKGIRDRAAELLVGQGRYNGQDQRWRLTNGKIIEFGAVQYEADKEKFQGRPHDLKGFDEITHFTESQFRFLIGWNRSADPTQRIRVVCAGNPPTSAEGDWVTAYWGPWLDPHHPFPAKPGEIRWFATVDGKDVECPTGEPFEHTNAQGLIEVIKPLSRTFIQARIQDNPYLMKSNYMATLQSLPEPLRSKMLLGDFGAGREDDAMQVIPSEWVTAAQQRWQARAPGRIDALGVDVARGGNDKTVISARSGHWMDHQKAIPGESTPNAPAVLVHIINAIPPGHKPKVQIDIIGVGAAVFDNCIDNNLDAHAMNASHSSFARDKSGHLGFVNKRAEWHWKMREMLDPESGEDIELPPDRELFADLTAPRWKSTVRGIQIESKDEIRDRIGRSPDKGDSCIISFAEPSVTPTARLI